jgi:hypothetical protein
MRTFNNRGQLLGDDSLPPDLQSMVDEANAGTPAASTVLSLPEMTVTAAAEAPFSLAQLLQPPYIYILAGALALAAYLYSKDNA